MNSLINGGTPHAHIDMGSLHLVIPQTDIHSIELSSVVTKSNACSPIAGYLQSMNHRWPVIALNEDLQVLGELPKQYRFILCLKTQSNQHRFAISCRQVKKTKLEEQYISLPPAIQANNIAILSAHVSEDQLCFKTNADRLLNHLCEEHDLTSVLGES
ncbi:MAG: hypothetical protein MI976_07070 [Pseudomonadales bacterium]|nr:hypothetical protein [Pseudomonadales bacterium]